MKLRYRKPRPRKQSLRKQSQVPVPGAWAQQSICWLANQTSSVQITVADRMTVQEMARQQQVLELRMLQLASLCSHWVDSLVVHELFLTALSYTCAIPALNRLSSAVQHARDVQHMVHESCPLSSTASSCRQGKAVSIGRHSMSPSAHNSIGFFGPTHCSVQATEGKSEEIHPVF